MGTGLFVGTIVKDRKEFKLFCNHCIKIFEVKNELD